MMGVDDEIDQMNGDLSKSKSKSKHFVANTQW